MKKITFLLTFLIATAGFAQTNLVDFEGASPSLTGFEGLGGAAVVANPNAAGVNTSANVAELIVSASGNPWQGAESLLQTNYIDVSDPVSNTISVDVYSTSAFTLYLQVENGQGGAVNAGADQPYTDVGNWQTLTFTMNESINGSGVANGEYEKLVFFPNWAGSGWNDPPVANTVYIDNVTGVQGSAIGGGTPDPEPATAAPVPTTGSGTVFSIYNDTNSYTNAFNVLYGFGTASEIDLDATAAVNNAFKINLNADGFGQGEGGPDDITSYDFLNFDYWFSNTTGTAGFVFILIDNDGAVQEFSYQVGNAGGGDGEDVVSETWTTVSIPMSYFTNLGFDATNLFQWKVDRYNQSGDNGGFLYLDNIVFTQGFPLSRDEFATFESRVFPNPASQSWNISTPNNTIKSVEIFNVLGRRVLSNNYNSDQVSVSVNSLASGIYIARLNTNAGTKTIKLIRE